MWPARAGARGEGELHIGERARPADCQIPALFDEPYQKGTVIGIRTDPGWEGSAQQLRTGRRF